MGPKLVIIFDVLTFLINLALITTIKIPQPQTATKSVLLVWQGLKEGLHFVRSSSALRFLITIMFLRGATMIGVFPLLPAFVQGDLQGNAFQVGLFAAAASMGFVLSSFFAVKLEKIVSPFHILIWGSALAGLLLLPFLLIRSFWLLLPFRLLSAFAYGAGNLVANVHLARLAPSGIRGRVSSLSWAFIKTAQVASSVTFGALATQLGTPVVITTAGLMLTFGCLLLAKFTQESAYKALKVETVS